MAFGQKLLGQILKEMELIKEGQLQEALAIQRKSGGALGEILIKLGYISRDDLMLALASQRELEIVNLDTLDIPQEVIAKIASNFASIYKIVPIRFEDNTLTVAMADPNNINILDDLRYMLHCEVRGALSSEAEINKALEKYYKQEAGKGI